MDENQINLQSDGYAGSVNLPIEGVYNRVAYQSPDRVARVLQTLKDDLFVMSWDPNFTF